MKPLEERIWDHVRIKANNLVTAWSNLIYIKPPSYGKNLRFT